MGRSTKRSTRGHLGAMLAAVLLAPPAIGLVADQGGDQFLDGIGETALVARYLFAGNAEDSSRNHLHATLRGIGAAYVEDARFGRVLELTGSGGYVQLPGHAVAGEDAISVALWLYLPTGASGPVFDVRQTASSRLSASVSAAAVQRRSCRGRHARRHRAGTRSRRPVGARRRRLRSPERPADDVSQWRESGQAAAAGVTVGAGRSARGRRCEQDLFGRSQDDGAPTLQGRLRDGRVYRVRVDRRAGRGHQRRRVGPPGWSRPGSGSCPGHLDRRHPQRIPLGGSARTCPQHPPRNVRRPAPPAAARVPAVYRVRASARWSA